MHSMNTALRTLIFLSQLINVATYHGSASETGRETNHSYTYVDLRTLIKTIRYCIIIDSLSRFDKAFKIRTEACSYTYVAETTPHVLFTQYNYIYLKA